jgi:hypothetical protein
MSVFGRFGVAALCGVALLIIIDVMLAGHLSPGSRIAYGIVVRGTLYGIAAVVSAMAAKEFSWWNQHIGRAWTLFALEFALLLLNYVLRQTAPGATLALSITLVGANLAQIAAYWLMARVLAAAKIGLLVSPAKRILLIVAALAIAVLLSYEPLQARWTAMQSGDVGVASLVSVLADVVTFTLVAPLAMATLTLHGGQLFWIFGFLTIAVIGWMINGAAESIAGLAGGGATAIHAIRLAGAAIGALFNTAAAATQWLAARRTMTGADHDG